MLQMIVPFLISHLTRLHRSGAATNMLQSVTGPIRRLISPRSNVGFAQKSRQSGTDSKMAPTVFIVYYSMYGHVYKLCKEAEEGLKEAGVTVKMFQVQETLPEEVLGKMHAPPKQDVPIINASQLPEADGYLFATPTRFGNLSAQFKTFWDSTGQLWMKQELDGRPFSLITSSASQGGGQESTFLASLPNFIHHGMIYVPMGTKFGAQLYDNSAVRGGSPWGPGTFANGDGSRQPSEVELGTAKFMGKRLGEYVKKLAA